MWQSYCRNNSAHILSGHIMYEAEKKYITINLIHNVCHCTWQYGALCSKWQSIWKPLNSCISDLRIRNQPFNSADINFEKYKIQTEVHTFWQKEDHTAISYETNNQVYTVWLFFTTNKNWPGMHEQLYYTQLQVTSKQLHWTV